MVRLHGEEERVCTYRPGAASGPAMPKHCASATLERRLLSLAVAATSPCGHCVRLREAICLTSRSCGQKETFPSQARAAPRGF